MRSLRFAAETDESCAAEDLIAQQLGGDEALRAAFAPTGRRLNAEYGGDAVEFFRACRSDMRAPVTVLADWAKDATSKTVRVAVLRYLLEGELYRRLADELTRDGLRGWMDDLPDSCLAAFSEQEQIQIRSLLGSGYADLAEIWQPLSDTSTVVANTQTALERIAGWWEANSTEELEAFMKRTYPTGSFFDISRQAPSNDRDRCEWLKLFLLGVLQTIPRTRPEANRNFVQECANRGWFDDLAIAPRQPTRWLRSWLEYVSEQETEIKFYQHMKNLAGLAIIAMHLDDYVELFLASDRIDSDFPLTAITQSRASSFFQGGGLDAPPISEVLGIGQCFIMRELVRQGLLENPNVFKHCFVPAERVRRIVATLGGPDLETSTHKWELSRAIHDFLVEHLDEQGTFALAFDIPLRVVAERPELMDLLLNDDLEAGSASERGPE